MSTDPTTTPPDLRDVEGRSRYLGLLRHQTADGASPLCQAAVASADDVPALVAELRQARRVVAAAQQWRDVPPVGDEELMAEKEALTADLIAAVDAHDQPDDQPPQDGERRHFRGSLPWPDAPAACGALAPADDPDDHECDLGACHTGPHECAGCGATWRDAEPAPPEPDSGPGWTATEVDGLIRALESGQVATPWTRGAELVRVLLASYDDAAEDIAFLRGDRAFLRAAQDAHEGELAEAREGATVWRTQAQEWEDTSARHKAERDAVRAELAEARAEVDQLRSAIAAAGRFSMDSAERAQQAQAEAHRLRGELATARRDAAADALEWGRGCAGHLRRRDHPADVGRRGACRCPRHPHHPGGQRGGGQRWLIPARRADDRSPPSAPAAASSPWRASGRTARGGRTAATAPSRPAR